MWCVVDVEMEWDHVKEVRGVKAFASKKLAQKFIDEENAKPFLGPHKYSDLYMVNIRNAKSLDKD